MRVEYAKRAFRDLQSIAVYYANCDHPAVGAKVADRIEAVVARIAHAPGSGRPVSERPGVRVAPLLRYPYNIFYAVRGETVRILHIRHTARRPWTEG